MKDCTPSVLSTAIIAVYMSMKKLGPPTMGGGGRPLTLYWTYFNYVLWSGILGFDAIASYLATVCIAWITGHTIANDSLAVIALTNCGASLWMGSFYRELATFAVMVILRGYFLEKFT